MVEEVKKTKMEKFISWLKQPSTIKAIVIFAGLAGVTIEPSRANEIITSAIVLYGGVAAFIDKN